MPGGRLAKQPGFPNRKRRVKLCPGSILQRGQAAILEPGGAPECPPACERPRGGPSFGPLFFGEDLGQSQAIPLISLERGRPGSVPVPGGNKGHGSRQAAGGTKAPIPSAFEATGRGVDGPDREIGSAGEGVSLPCDDPCGRRPIGGEVRL